MGDLSGLDKPRKLLRWTELFRDDVMVESENEEHSSKLISEGSADGSLEKNGASSERSETTAQSRREAWFGTKIQRLKKNADKLRKDLNEKERDYIRLKNKYSNSKRRLEQLQEDLNRCSEEKLDTDAELEFLRLQLAEKETQLSEFQNNTRFVRRDEKSGKTQLEWDDGIEDGVTDSERSLKTFYHDSFLVKQYLNIHKDARQWMVYCLLGAAFCFSLIALFFSSSVISAVAVGLWTLGFCCIWQERKEIYRGLKLKYVIKIQQISVMSSQLRHEKQQLVVLKEKLEKELASEIKDKDDVMTKFMSLSKKIVKEKAKNEDLSKKWKKIDGELQSERVRRRLAEERLEEVSAQLIRAKEAGETARCGDVCQQLRESLKSEREKNEKLDGENQRLIEEIVAINMNAERERMRREKDGVGMGEAVEINTKDGVVLEEKEQDNPKKDCRDKNLELQQVEDGGFNIEPSDESKMELSTESFDQPLSDCKSELSIESNVRPLTECNTQLSDETKILSSSDCAIQSNTETNIGSRNKCKMQSSFESDIPLSANSKIQSAEIDSRLDKGFPENPVEPAINESGNKLLSTVPKLETDAKRNIRVAQALLVLPKPCWFCVLNVSTEGRLGFFVVLSACLMLLLHSILSSTMYTILCLLSMAVVGILSYYRPSTKSKTSA